MDIEFLNALKSGLVCLHPTDSLPGLTCDPGNLEAHKKLCEMKNRPDQKSMISLVHSLEEAQKWWKPLPDLWEKTLGEVWPASLSVIWFASDDCPLSLVSETGQVALRVPGVSSGTWLRKILANISFPLPTTSVNVGGMPAAETWAEAETWCREHGVYVPKRPDFQPSGSSSTIIEIFEDLSFTVRRSGCFPAERLLAYGVTCN